MKTILIKECRVSGELTDLIVDTSPRAYCVLLRAYPISCPFIFLKLKE